MILFDQDNPSFGLQNSGPISLLCHRLCEKAIVLRRSAGASGVLLCWWYTEAYKVDLLGFFVEIYDS